MSFLIFQSKRRAKNAVNLVSKVGDSLLGTKAVGEKPTVFNTKSLDVLLDRQRSSDMEGKRLGDGPSGVALPSGSSLFSGQGDGPPEAVDSQVSNGKRNENLEKQKKSTNERRSLFTN